MLHAFEQVFICRSVDAQHYDSRLSCWSIFRNFLYRSTWTDWISLNKLSSHEFQILMIFYFTRILIENFSLQSMIVTCLIDKLFIIHDDRSSSSFVYLATSIRITHRQRFWSFIRKIEFEVNLWLWIEVDEWSVRMLILSRSITIIICQSNCSDKNAAITWIL